MDCTEIDLLWELADPLTVTDTAALIAGFDPDKLFNKDDEFGGEVCEAKRQKNIVFSALTNAINAGKRKAKIRHNSWINGYDEQPVNGEAWSTAHPVSGEEMSNALLGKRPWIRRIEPNWTGQRQRLTGKT